MPRIHFLLDEQIPLALAERLTRRGIESHTAVQAGLLGAPDEAYLSRCAVERWVLVTQDQDFLRLHAHGAAHAGIVFWEQRRRSIGQVVEGLTLMHGVMDVEEMAGRLEFL